MREIQALKYLDGHPNVIQLKDVLLDGDTIIMTFEYLVNDLYDILNNMGEGGLSEHQILYVIYQLLCAVNNEIIHRDLKPSNIMFDKTGVLKLIDYGWARVDVLQLEEYKDWFSDTQNDEIANSEGSGDQIINRWWPKYSLEVGTRWYKAPEMLLGSKTYDNSIDVWAIGCIFAELMGDKPIFKGMNDIEQIIMIIRTLGTPNHETWPEFEQLPDYHKLVFPDSQGIDLRDHFSNQSSELVKFMSKFLQFNPKSRISIEDALSDPM